MTAEQEYQDMISGLITEIEARPEHFRDLDGLMTDLVLDHPATLRVIRPLSAHPLNHKPAAFHAAMNRRRRVEAADARQAAEAQREADKKALLDEIGGEPEDERAFVNARLGQLGYKMSFDSVFKKTDGTEVAIMQVENDLHLTASRLFLTPPRGKVLSGKNITRALEDFVAEAREDARQRVIANIAFDPDGQFQALANFRHTCGLYFEEPDFALAALCKFIWQVKRKLAGLRIKEHHMIVLQGPQDGGKTTFINFLCRPICELKVDCDIDALLDDKNFDLRDHYAGVVDELAKATQAVLAKLKTLITGDRVSSRIHYSHGTHKQKFNLTCVGSVDQPLGTIVYDAAGMRRFVEIKIKPRRQVTAHWQQIEDFDFRSVWRAIDPQSPDPLLPFEAVLQAKQEDMRSKTKVEAWAEQFEYSNGLARKARNADRTGAEFSAKELYEDFHRYEEYYHPGSRGTSLPMFGRQLTQAIDLDRAPEWTKRIVGKSTLYRYNFPHVRSETEAVALLLAS
jgi:Virulence-associated protein E